MAWSAICAVVGAAWTVAACWRVRGGSAEAVARGILGGIAALGAASGVFALLDLAGVAVRWELVTRGAWPGLAVAAAIGAVEETAKLAGIVLALPSRSGRDVFRTTALTATVFAVVEAALVLRGATWPLAVGRAALAPVAHAALSIPFAFALAGARGPSRARDASRVALTLGVAALLHGFGDWCVARPGWGRIGFALALLAPVAWLYARLARARRRGDHSGSVASSARNSSATPHACAMQPRGV